MWKNCEKNVKIHGFKIEEHIKLVLRDIDHAIAIGRQYIIELSVRNKIDEHNQLQISIQKEMVYYKFDISHIFENYIKNYY